MHLPATAQAGREVILRQGLFRREVVLVHGGLTSDHGENLERIVAAALAVTLLGAILVVEHHRSNRLDEKVLAVRKELVLRITLDEELHRPLIQRRDLWAVQWRVCEHQATR